MLSVCKEYTQLYVNNKLKVAVNPIRLGGGGGGGGEGRGGGAGRGRKVPGVISTFENFLVI